jgi:hypothetical protein
MPTPPNHPPESSMHSGDDGRCQLPPSSSIAYLRYETKKSNERDPEKPGLLFLRICKTQQ